MTLIIWPSSLQLKQRLEGSFYDLFTRTAPAHQQIYYSNRITKLTPKDIKILNREFFDFIEKRSIIFKYMIQMLFSAMDYSHLIRSMLDTVCLKN